MTASITFFEHADGRHRTHMRNTVRGWVEERDPEGWIHVKLDDGFNYVMPGDERDVTELREFCIETAEYARDRYWAGRAEARP